MNEWKVKLLNYLFNSMPTINRSPGTLNANYEQFKVKYTTPGAVWVALKGNKVLYCIQLYSK